MLDLSSWPAGMRVIARKERPHPGAQLRFTDIDAHHFTTFATSTKTGQLADLELRHRRRARVRGPDPGAEHTRLRNLPLHAYAQNQVWYEIITLACELVAWTQMLAFDARPAAGSRSGCGYGSSPLLDVSSAAAAAYHCAESRTGPGPVT
jgi:hypothetical protein